MIVANSTWGGLLAERNIACLYRAQTQGKVRMTTSPCRMKASACRNTPG
jgi:exoribonuclease-2